MEHRHIAGNLVQNRLNFFRMALPLNFETAAQEIRGVLEDFLNQLVARQSMNPASLVHCEQCAGMAALGEWPRQ